MEVALLLVNFGYYGPPTLPDQRRHNDDRHEKNIAKIIKAVKAGDPHQSIKNIIYRPVMDSVSIKCVLWDIINDGGRDKYGDDVYDFAKMTLDDYYANHRTNSNEWMFADSADYINMWDRSVLWDLVGKPRSMCCSGQCRTQKRLQKFADMTTEYGYRFELIPPNARAILMLGNRKHIRDEEYNVMDTAKIIEYYEAYANQKKDQGDERKVEGRRSDRSLVSNVFDADDRLARIIRR